MMFVIWLVVLLVICLERLTLWHLDLQFLFASSRCLSEAVFADHGVFSWSLLRSLPPPWWSKVCIFSAGCAIVGHLAPAPPRTV